MGVANQERTSQDREVTRMSNLLRNHNIHIVRIRIGFHFPGCNHLYDFMQESGRRRGEGV